MLCPLPSFDYRPCWIIESKWWNNAKVGADDDCIWGTLEDTGLSDKEPASAAAYGTGNRSRSIWLTDSVLIP